MQGKCPKYEDLHICSRNGSASAQVRFASLGMLWYGGTGGWKGDLASLVELDLLRCLFWKKGLGFFWCRNKLLI